VDGVLADFRSAFRALARSHDPSDSIESTSPPQDAPLAAFEIRRLWNLIAHTPNWWLQLKAYEPEEIARLYALARQNAWEVFFVTKRPKSAGDTVLVQTQWWLERHGFYMPAVVTVPGSRGELANALRLDLVLDDQIDNCAEVISASSAKAVLMLRDSRQADLRALATDRGVGVVPNLQEGLHVMQRLQEVLAQRKGRLARLADWFQTSPDRCSTVPLDPRPFRRTDAGSS
jgi:hypothetical protein